VHAYFCMRSIIFILCDLYCLCLYRSWTRDAGPVRVCLFEAGLRQRRHMCTCMGNESGGGSNSGSGIVVVLILAGHESSLLAFGVRRATDRSAEARISRFLFPPEDYLCRWLHQVGRGFGYTPRGVLVAGFIQALWIGLEQVKHVCVNRMSWLSQLPSFVYLRDAYGFLIPVQDELHPRTRRNRHRRLGRYHQ
jgi:hypothetical protein